MARTIAKDHSEKRAQILKTAAKVFAASGISGASMKDVAAACGISKANIYHYYDGKDALLFDILDTYLAELRDRLCGLPDEGLTPEDRLHAFARETLFAYEGMDAEHRLQPEGIPLLPADQQEILKNYQREIVRKLSAILKEAAPDVLAGDRKKLRAATMSVFGMVNWFYMWNSGADRAERETYALFVANMALKGIKGL